MKKNYVGTIGNPDKILKFLIMEKLSELAAEIKPEDCLAFPQEKQTTPVLDKIYNECAVYPETAWKQLRVKRPSDSTTWK